MSDDGAQRAKAPARNRLTGRYAELADYVSRAVGGLQSAYLDDTVKSRHAGAAASLARLRRAARSEPGADPLVWKDTLENLPEQFFGRDAEPSREERAVHNALTLYAIHQQSRQQPMHRKNVSLGSAAARLSSEGSRDGQFRSEAVTKRFQIIGTASSLAETLHHARGLIGQLRAAKIPLDYGQLAVDLARLQDPRAADGVRLQWGRDYYFSRPLDGDGQTEATTNDPEQPKSPEETDGTPS